MMNEFSAARERKALDTRLRLFSQTVEQSPLAVIVTDLDGRIQYVTKPVDPDALFKSIRGIEEY